MVLASGSNVLVHLRPAPVVARVMTGTAELHDDVETWLSREVAVGRFLGERGLAVSPADLAPPGPHQQDGLWMTFWELAEVDGSAGTPTAEALGRALRDMHDALAEFTVSLGPLSDVRDWLDRLAAELPAEAGNGLRRRLTELSPVVFESSLALQPIHGDVAIGNLLQTPGGLLWNDFEDVCAGPVHWDVAGLVAEARELDHGEAFAAAIVDAYGGIELGELDEFAEAHTLYATIWHAHAAQRRA